MKRWSLLVALVLLCDSSAYAASVSNGGSVVGAGGVVAADIDTCAELAAIYTDETGTCGAPVLSQAPTIVSPTISTKINLPRVTALPGTPSTGDTVIVTDDSGAGACDSNAGSTTTICMYNGSAWIPIGDGGNAAFNAITSGTNTTATMTCGAGCSVVPTSTGVIAATVARPTVTTINAGNDPYTALTTDYVLLCDTTGSTRSITLPAATNKIIYRLKNLGSNACTVTRAGSDTIDGGTSVVLTLQYQSIDLVADGTSSWSVY